MLFLHLLSLSFPLSLFPSLPLSLPPSLSLSLPPSLSPSLPLPLPFPLFPSLSLSLRTGCKPFVEVFQDGERVFTSATHDSLDKIRSFHNDDGGVEIPLGLAVRGNIVLVVHHVRAIPIARKAGLVRNNQTLVFCFVFSVFVCIVYMNKLFVCLISLSFPSGHDGSSNVPTTTAHRFLGPIHQTIHLREVCMPVVYGYIVIYVQYVLVTSI